MRKHRILTPDSWGAYQRNTSFLCSALVFIHFYWSIVSLQSCVRFYCKTKWISYTYTYIPFFRFPSLWGPHRALSRAPCAVHSRRSLIISVIHTSVYMSIPISQFDDPVVVGNLISGSSAFSKSSLNIWKFTVHVLLKPQLENFEHCFAVCEMSTIVQ